MTDPVSLMFPNTVIKMSTTNTEPGGLRDVFSENVGTDEQIVFEGDLPFSTANSGPPDGPKVFDFVFELQKNTYDPTTGRNLIFDFETAGTDLVISQTTDFVVEIGPDFEEVAAFTEGATMATGRWGGNVVQFTFVPEPASLRLALMGFILVASGCRRMSRFIASR